DADTVSGTLGRKTPPLDQLADVVPAENLFGGVVPGADHVAVVHRPVVGILRNTARFRGRPCGLLVRLLAARGGEQAAGQDDEERVMVSHRCTPGACSFARRVEMEQGCRSCAGATAGSVHCVQSLIAQEASFAKCSRNQSAAALELCSNAAPVYIAK